MIDRLMPVREGLLLGVLAVAYGWGLGVAFGAVEDAMKDGLRSSAEASRALYLEKSGGDANSAAAAVKETLDKSWNYYQRAHLHAGAIGAVTIGLSLALAFLETARLWRRLASSLLGLGALGYPLFWMLAAQRAPALASTAAAKESLAWLAVPATASLLAGLVLSIGLLAGQLYRRRTRSEIHQ